MNLLFVKSFELVIHQIVWTCYSSDYSTCIDIWYKRAQHHNISDFGEFHIQKQSLIFRFSFSCYKRTFFPSFPLFTSSRTKNDSSRIWGHPICRIDFHVFRCLLTFLITYIVCSAVWSPCKYWHWQDENNRCSCEISS